MLIVLSADLVLILTLASVAGLRVLSLFGPKARDAIHAWQLQAGLAPADGFATPALVASLRGTR